MNKNINTYSLKQALLLLCFSTTFFACESFLDLDPPRTSVVDENVFKSANTADAAVRGIYLHMYNSTNTPNLINGAYLSPVLGIAADELDYFGTEFDNFKNNRLIVSDISIQNVWTSGYRTIYQTNACVEGLRNNNQINVSQRDRMLGESLFLRALNYYYLVNLWGAVPLVLSTNYEVTGSLPRTSVDVIYQQIIEDLTESESLLGEDYYGTGKTRVNKHAANALLARIFLYRGNWQEAYDKATTVINANYALPETDEVFKVESTEAIWQLQNSATPTSNSIESSRFLPTNQPLFYVNTALVDSFEEGDARLSWLGTFEHLGESYIYPFKYQAAGSTPNGIQEHLVMLRLAEQYLIRAEASAHLNNLSGAIGDLNKVRERAGIPAYTSLPSQEVILDWIALERRKELFSEQGHRWFDLKRTGKIAQVLGDFKNTSWDANNELWPVPQNQLLANPNLDQNPGYGQ
ncbi:RagB/SusD family nutrient uptake outer membrane protein [Belliella sp. DSM 111904]|uniref:RagB/SusD family nutrient uptake outer membrane protein n=1 Tax=Belliella filtrata TaxID=2923435 RepID=A0ABS9UXL0_9BACT|nr:RagB/SusD family nutrient uptake outer membrane protein [Belliella filtrata]MCH7408922.1 RagB/SusD family nutrient uptake outer membrane protein [Belliella filtrata]